MRQYYAPSQQRANLLVSFRSDTQTRIACLYDHLLGLQICAVFSVMIVPYFSSLWWGYRCQPWLQMPVVALYYGAAMYAAFMAVLAKSSFARCACLLSRACGVSLQQHD